MKLRRAWNRPDADRREGVATLELVIVLPILLFFVVVIFQVGHALTLRQRATVATRHATWVDSMRDGVSDTDQLRDWITATSVSLDTSSTTESIFGEAGGTDRRALDFLLTLVPLDFSTSVEMTTDFEPPFQTRFGEPRITTESVLFKDTWYTEPEHEGLWGFLSKAAEGIAEGISL